MKILLTGFKSKENATNASEILVTSLINELPGSLKSLSGNIEIRVVNDNTNSVKEELEDIIAKTNPSFCLFTGQAPGYNRVTLETMATNYRFIAPPVKVGKSPQGQYIEKEGAAAYKASLSNMQEIVERIQEKGIPASISHNCGNSLCNQILYHGLHYASGHKSELKCGFLHIPALPEQVLTQWPQHPFMPLDMSRKAVEIVINSIYKHYEYI